MLRTLCGAMAGPKSEMALIIPHSDNCRTFMVAGM